MSLKPQADHTMCLRLISDDERGAESLMVIKKVLKIECLHKVK